MDVLRRLSSSPVIGIGQFHFGPKGMELDFFEDHLALSNLYFWERSGAHDAIVSYVAIVALKCRLENQNHPLIVMCDECDVKTLVVCVDNLYKVLVCQQTYPDRVGWSVLRGKQFTLAEVQDPKQIDVLYKVQEELKVVKMNMHDVIDQIIIRGERLEDLQSRAQGLADTSIVFYKRAQKLNRCCVLL